MIDIPLNKALVAVEATKASECEGCYVLNFDCCYRFNCSSVERKDGKNVIFKLVDYQGEEK